ncbi:hypothetical protein CLM83_29170, partial [Streptomyces albidoflavus]
APRPAALAGPEDGWSSGWWTDRWLWTAGGAVLAALAGIFGYTLTRGNGRPGRVPPGLCRAGRSARACRTRCSGLASPATTAAARPSRS